MEDNNTNNTNQKIYKFDKKLFSKSFVPYIGLFLLIGIGIYLFACIPYFFSSPSMICFDYEYVLSYIVILIIANIITYTGMRRLANYNYFEIQSENEVFCLHKYGYAFKEQSTILRIDTLKKTPFCIKVRGSIETVHLYYAGRPEPYVAKKKRLRIPAYFENMGEIYSELEKIKDGTYGVS